MASPPASATLNRFDAAVVAFLAIDVLTAVAQRAP
jgi:hypothetical protein